MNRVASFLHDDDITVRCFILTFEMEKKIFWGNGNSTIYRIITQMCHNFSVFFFIFLPFVRPTQKIKRFESNDINRVQIVDVGPTKLNDKLYRVANAADVAVAATVAHQLECNTNRKLNTK